MIFLRYLQKRTQCHRFLLLGVWLSVFVCIDFGGVRAEVVTTVRVNGTKFVLKREVLSWLVTRAGTTVDSVLIQKDIRRILEGYRDRGYWQVAVAYPQIAQGHDGVVLTFDVTEGKQTRIDSIAVGGDLKFAEQDIRIALGMRKSMALVTSDLQQHLSNVLQFYENRGYPFCELRPMVDFMDDGVQVHLNVVPGPFVRIDSVRFEGNTVTQSDMLVRQIKFVAGEIYDHRRVVRFEARLKRLPFVERVDRSELEVVDGKMVLVIEVAEAQHTRIKGGLGLGSGSGQVGQVLTGTVAIDVLNFAGGGREGRALWARRGVGISNLNVYYREPWIFKSPVSVWGTVEMDERLGYVAHRFGGGVDVSIADGATLFVGAAHNRVLPDSTGLGIYGEENMWSLQAGIQMDRRDDRWNPRRGWRAELTGEIGEVATGVYRKGGTGGGEVFWPLGRRSTIMGRLNTRWLSQTNGVPETAAIRLGGAQTLRGYNEEVFWGTKAGWGNLEWRWLLGPKARIFAFVDAGGIGGYGTRIWPLSYGVGLLANARLGAIGVDYGLPRGESLGQGFVHVRMVGEF